LAEHSQLSDIREPFSRVDLSFVDLEPRAKHGAIVRVQRTALAIDDRE
jgi:hypothetical protein